MSAAASDILRDQPSCMVDGVQDLPTPYVLFLGDVDEPGYAKTAFGLRDWARDKCVGECVSDPRAVTTGLSRISPAEAVQQGARSLVIAVANRGGLIPASWRPTLFDALAQGLDIVSGMHVRLEEVPGLAEAASKLGRRLIDIRVPPPDIPIATGRKRVGKRLLTVGTDCALGKKYTALAIAEEMARLSIDADFRATGQTGIMIAGRGIPMDAVVADFEAGAAEILSPDAQPDHWDVIEGQGSLFHPAYAAVSLGLLHGSQPDVFVVCHDPRRTTILGAPNFPLPDVQDVIDLTIQLGRRTNPAIRCGGVSLNTSALGLSDADEVIASESRRLGLPVADPMRRGATFELLVANCLGAQ